MHVRTETRAHCLQRSKLKVVFTGQWVLPPEEGVFTCTLTEQGGSMCADRGAIPTEMIVVNYQFSHRHCRRDTPSPWVVPALAAHQSTVFGGYSPPPSIQLRDCPLAEPHVTIASWCVSEPEGWCLQLCSFSSLFWPLRVFLWLHVNLRNGFHFSKQPYWDVDTYSTESVAAQISKIKVFQPVVMDVFPFICVFNNLHQLL